MGSGLGIQGGDEAHGVQDRQPQGTLVAYTGAPIKLHGPVPRACLDPSLLHGYRYPAQALVPGTPAVSAPCNAQTSPLGRTLRVPLAWRFLRLNLRHPPVLIPPTAHYYTKEQGYPPLPCGYYTPWPLLCRAAPAVSTPQSGPAWTSLARIHPPFSLSPPQGPHVNRPHQPSIASWPVLTPTGFLNIAILPRGTWGRKCDIHIRRLPSSSVSKDINNTKSQDRPLLSFTFQIPLVAHQDWS